MPQFGYEEIRFIVATIAFVAWLFTKSIREQISNYIEEFWGKLSIANRRYSELLKLEIEYFFLFYVKITFLLWRTVNEIANIAERIIAIVRFRKPDIRHYYTNNLTFSSALQYFQIGFISQDDGEEVPPGLHNAFSFLANLVPAFLFSLILYVFALAIRLLITPHDFRFSIYSNVVFLNGFLDSLSYVISVLILLYLREHLSFKNLILFVVLDSIIAIIFSYTLYIYITFFSSVFSLVHLIIPALFVLNIIWFAILLYNYEILRAIKDKVTLVLLFVFTGLLLYCVIIDFPNFSNIGIGTAKEYFKAKNTYFTTLHFIFSNFPITTHELWIYNSAFLPTTVHCFILAIVLLTKLLKKPMVFLGAILKYLFIKRTIINLFTEIVLVTIGIISLWPKSFSLFIKNILRSFLN